MLKLFDDIEHKGEEGKPHSEADFPYLNRIDRIEARRIRNVLEDWFSRYPQEHQSNLRTRFRASEFQSAFFELLLHEMLSHLDCNVTIHPELEDEEPKRPDFLVQSYKKAKFLLEATTTSDLSREEKANENIKNLIYDKINEKLRSPDYFIIIEIRQSSKQTPSSSKAVSFLADQLSTLNIDDVRMLASKNNLGCMPCFVYQEKGWEIALAQTS